MTDLPPAAETWLRNLVNGVGLSDRWVEIRQRALPAFTVEAVADNDVEVVGCRLGGLPALPGSAYWPTRDGRAFTFVGQFNLADIAAGSVGLPASGLLGFFVGQDEPAADIDHRVVYFADTDALVSCPPPVTVFLNDERSSFQPCSVVLRSVATLPERLVWDLTGDEEGFSAAVAPNLPGGQSRLGGHCGSDLAHDAYLCSVGRKSILYDRHRSVEEVRHSVAELVEEGRDEHAAILASMIPDLVWYETHRHRHEEEAAHWRVLFEVNSHDEADMLWWDAGQLVILIDDRDLAAGRFDRTYAAIESG